MANNMVTNKHMKVSNITINLVMEMMAGFEQQAPGGGQQYYNQMPESSFGNPNQSAFPGSSSNQVQGMGQQNFGSQPGQSMPTNQRWRSPSRISFPLAKIRCLSQIMVTRGNSKWSSNQVQNCFLDRGTRMSGCAKHVKYI